MFTNILIPTDGSAVSRKAIKAGVKLAQALGAKVTGYYAIVMLAPSTFGDGDLIEESVRRTLDVNRAKKSAPRNRAASTRTTSACRGRDSTTTTSSTMAARSTTRAAIAASRWERFGPSR